MNTTPTELSAEQVFTVFFAWQSNLPSEVSRNFIRSAFRAASDLLEERFFDQRIRFELDEATRQTPGSPNIPALILSKITAADMFLGDLSIVIPKADEHDPSPNPNVLFELGYAVAELGWDRVVILGNAAYEVYPEDLPFDVDRQRASSYRVNEAASTAEAAEVKRQLTGLLVKAVETIVEQAPLRPAEKRQLTPEERRRRHDVATIEEILCAVHIPTLEDLLERGPYLLPHRVFHFWEAFHARVSVTDFHLYDEELRSRVERVHELWEVTVSHGDYYRPTPGGDFVFGVGVAGYRSPDEEEVGQRLQDATRALDEAFRALMRYVRENYLEVDPTRCSEEATRTYNRWLADRGFD